MKYDVIDWFKGTFVFLIVWCAGCALQRYAFNITSDAWLMAYGILCAATSFSAQIFYQSRKAQKSVHININTRNKV